MLLGILIHASNVYTPESAWIVVDPPGHPFFGLLSDALHVFRMPAFFWISGFFCAMTFVKSDPVGLLRSRVPRIVIPLVVTYLTLNVTQDLLVRRMTLSASTLESRPMPDLYHLWFLVDLLVFVALAAAILPLLAPRVGSALMRADRWVLIAAATVVSYAGEFLVRATGFAYDQLLHLTSLYRLAQYFPFFLAGMVFYFRTDALAEALQTSWVVFPLALAVAVAIDPLVDGSATILTEFARLLQIGATWACVFSLLALFDRSFRKGTRFTHVVSDSAYSVYLFHHIVVVVLAVSLATWDASPWIKFVVVCACSASTALLVHALVIRRQPWLRLLFNGKRPSDHTTSN